MTDWPEPERTWHQQDVPNATKYKGMTIHGPMYDLYCPVCGKSICEGEFEGSRTNVKLLADKHRKTHEDEGSWPTSRELRRLEP